MATVRRGRVLDHRRRDHDERRRLVPAARAHRRRPAGVRDPQPAERQPSPGQHRLDALADQPLVVLRQPQPRRRPLQPLEVQRQRERLVVHDLDRLEHPVADRQPVVADRDGRRRRVVEELSVDPRTHAPRLGGTPTRHARQTPNWRLLSVWVWFCSFCRATGGSKRT